MLLSILISLTNACSNNNKTGNSDSTTNSVLISNDTCKLIDNYLSKLSNEINFSGGLLIVKDGKNIFSQGYGWADKDKKIPFTPSTLASIGSITKAFTATAIMKLVEQNKLSLDDQQKKYFPTIPVDKAIVLYNYYTQTFPNIVVAWNDLGDIYQTQNKKDEAIKCYKQALKIRPENPRAKESLDKLTK